ncbi:MAG TPA: Crp/Fnr family transcriptional regulator [Bacteroidia bacterium]|nr:Crp/Fnr family transcriptional regulator [Bacteroidia bacterium]
MQDLEQRLEHIFEKNLVSEILSCGKRMFFKEGEVIMEYGKKLRFMPFILSGSIRVMTHDENNRELLLYYLGSTESCAMAYACCMEDKKSEIRAIAEDDVELIAIPHDKLDEWLVKYPSWKSYVFNSFTQRFNELLKSLESVAFQKLDERLVKYLNDKARVSGKTSLQLSHNQIAEEMGTSRVVISRLLKQLEHENKVVLYRNEIKLLSRFQEATG